MAAAASAVSRAGCKVERAGQAALRSPAGATQATGRNFAGFGLTRADGIVPPCLRTILSPEWSEGNEISVACACVRIGRACNGPATTLRARAGASPSSLVHHLST
jgi:hypothetical protein